MSAQSDVGGTLPRPMQVSRYFAYIEYIVLLSVVAIAWGGSWVAVFVLGWFSGEGANQAFLAYLVVSVLVLSVPGVIVIWSAHQVERLNRSQSGETTSGGD